MEINEFFNELPVRIIGTHERPLFYATDIAKILGIRQICRVIADFSPNEILQKDEREKLDITTYQQYKDSLPKRNDNIVLLTERGIYRLLISHQSEIAEQFRSWVFDVLEDLRSKGKYEIQQEMQKLKITAENVGLDRDEIIEKNRKLLEAQEQFKNFTEKLYVVELKNNLRLIKQRHVREDELDIDSDDDSDDDIGGDGITDNSAEYGRDKEKNNRIDNWDMYCKMFPNPEDRTPEFSYKVTQKLDKRDLTQGTVKYYMFVKDAKKALAKLDEKLFLYRLSSIDTAHYYCCNLEKIKQVVDMVLKPASE